MLFKIYCFFVRLFKIKLEEEPVREFEILVIKHAEKKVEHYEPIKMKPKDTLSLNSGIRKPKDFLKLKYDEDTITIDVYTDSYYKKLKKKK